MTNDTAIVLLIADLSREREALKEEVRRLQALLEQAQKHEKDPGAPTPEGVGAEAEKDER